MTELNCESVRVSAMAVNDGEPPLISPAQLEAHLAECADCRREVEQLKLVSDVLSARHRRQTSVEVWGLIGNRLSPRASVTKTPFDWRQLLLLGFVLAGYKVLVMLPLYEIGLWSKLVPVALAVAVFGYLKENPFKINPELRLEGE